MKYLFRFFLGLVLSIGCLMIIANAFDSELSPDTKEVLEHDLETNEGDDLKCASLLGLAVNEKFDFQKVGLALLHKLQSIPKGELNAALAINIPGRIDSVKRPEKWVGIQELTKVEIENIEPLLKPHRVYLDRFSKLLNVGGIRCHLPVSLIKMPLLSLLSTARNYLLDLNIKVARGKQREVFSSLEKMNQFFLVSLESEKLTIIETLVFLTILKEVRKSLISIAKTDENLRGQLAANVTSLFSPISYEDIVKRVVIGELQAASALINYPLDFRLLELTNIDGAELPKDLSFREKLVSKIVNYFYLPNNTINYLHQLLVKAPQQLCVQDLKKACDPESRSLFDYIRNPTGEYIALLVYGVQAPEKFRKIRNRIQELPASAKDQ